VDPTPCVLSDLDYRVHRPSKESILEKRASDSKYTTRTTVRWKSTPPPEKGDDLESWRGLKLDADRAGRSKLTRDAAPRLGIGLNPVQSQEPTVNR